MELNQRTLGRGGRRAASININQPLSTFHTSTVAAGGGPRVHLPWPLIAISPSNDAFPRVTCKCRPGPTGPNAGEKRKKKKVIAPLKPSPTLSSGASIKTDGAHTPLGCPLLIFIFITCLISTRDALRRTLHELGLPRRVLFSHGAKGSCTASCTYHRTSLHPNPSPIIRNSL